MRAYHDWLEQHVVKELSRTAQGKPELGAAVSHAVILCHIIPRALTQVQTALSAEEQRHWRQRKGALRSMDLSREPRAGTVEFIDYILTRSCLGQSDSDRRL